RTATYHNSTLSLHDALPIWEHDRRHHVEDLHTVGGDQGEYGRQAEREGDGDPDAEEEEEAAEKQKRDHFRPPWNSSASMTGAASLASLRVTASAEVSSCREDRRAWMLRKMPSRPASGIDRVNSHCGIDSEGVARPRIACAIVISAPQKSRT